MFKAGFSLSTQAHLEAASHNKSKVIVYYKSDLHFNEAITQRKPIESVDDECVCIDGELYIIDNCNFFIL